jgi:hypothetical protein
MKRAIAVLLALCVLGPSAVLADTLSPQQAAASKFVQKFYDWYMPIVLKPSKGDSSDVAIAKRSNLFDPPLLRALKVDSEAQRKSPGDIVGLDFDPFLNAQDPDDKYVVGDVSESGGLYLVSVYGVRKGKHAAKPDVVAEVKPAKDTFVFTNFRYGADGDLVAILKSLADERAHPATE